ncbi:N-acetyltransferase [Streptomyces sp. XD-27]|uniref:GNAT family N-acetyltransferase n=1 Tax=Streptomyces sp. XD-27 TaxID=3062779 RepID=UPI0026F47E67|nr:GNAT family N-acetyltransferase [Streptomyces sp. XD-27]WKX71199.1 GNAT family N-acetyltransferase [Streptomyces sp. XD-27]
MTTPPYLYRVGTPADDAELTALDDSFTTDTVYEVTATATGFSLHPAPVHPPLTKQFPDDDGDEDDDRVDHTVVAVDGDRICAFIALDYEDWNRRLVIRQITVAPTHRGKGIGRHLMARAFAYGHDRGARAAWLEVTNVNAPAIHAYQRMGFTLCGLDTTLYLGTQSEGETALFMSRPLVSPER